MLSGMPGGRSNDVPHMTCQLCEEYMDGLGSSPGEKQHAVPIGIYMAPLPMMWQNTPD